LKPENILLDEDDMVTVIDFGIAVAFNPEDGIQSIQGTCYYIAPEIFTEATYNEKCDVWSLGVILFVLLTGEPPFAGESDVEII
jgi:calcium-dependent protein kinase